MYIHVLQILHVHGQNKKKIIRNRKNSNKSEINTAQELEQVFPPNKQNKYVCYDVRKRQTARLICGFQI